VERVPRGELYALALPIELAEPMAADRPIPLKYEEVHGGDNTSHSSHILYVYRGLVYCNRCGVRSGRLGLRKLAKPCSPSSEYGVQSLKALRLGQNPPPILVHWPPGLSAGGACSHFDLCVQRIRNAKKTQVERVTGVGSQS